jgi:hypothetical protein
MLRLLHARWFVVYDSPSVSGHAVRLIPMHTLVAILRPQPGEFARLPPQLLDLQFGIAIRSVTLLLLSIRH